MELRRTSLLTGAESAQGMVVIIDVFRAFTTAAYAFARGAREIWLVKTPQDAFALRRELPNALLVGERDGRPLEGFDYGNSPSLIAQLDLNDKIIVQRTSSGTQGVVASRQAEEILLGSIVCAEATVQYILKRAPQIVTLVAMGNAGMEAAEEDELCASHLEARLHGLNLDSRALIQRIENLPAAQDVRAGRFPHFPSADLDCCLRLDEFDFAMVVERWEKSLVAKAFAQKAY
jgi:2-phosphosulfolactate phosphatase